MVKGTCVAKGSMSLEGGMHGKKGVCVAGEAATAVGGMHPTRMHSC